MKTKSPAIYDESSFKKLEFPESIRRRPGMYIGKLGNGKSVDDGIYILVKEAVDNSIDEFQMGFGREITLRLEESDGREWIEVRDNGRGIPLGVVKECASEVHGGAKFDSEAFQKSVGMNGVGIKAVNALSSHFLLSSARDGDTRAVRYEKGVLCDDHTTSSESKKDRGTRIRFSPDESLFLDYRFQPEYLSRMAFQYACLNPGLTLVFEISRDGVTESEVFKSEDGLRDYLRAVIAEDGYQDKLCYPVIHLVTEDLEVCLTHGPSYGENFHSFVNGQNTHQGGTHVAAAKEGVVAAVRDFTKKNFDPGDVRGSLIAAISVRLQEPVFESQTKTKLGSTHTKPLGAGVPIRSFVGDFIKRELNNTLHKLPDTAKALEAKILQNERERKELAGIKEKSKELAKKANLANRKLRDCRIHYDGKNENRANSTLFITEGDSASGSITQVRDANTQAVFSLKGKPANVFGKNRRAIYENEELHLLQAALGIENGMEDLRFNNIVIATDADVDGMHIRLLMTTFFMTFFPELIKEGHVHILQTPLFRVRNKKETRYCYSEDERDAAVRVLGEKAEITRFKGLGEISPGEFKSFIGPKMRLEPLVLDSTHKMDETIAFFMGANCPERQQFLCQNLNIEAA